MIQILSFLNSIVVFDVCVGNSVIPGNNFEGHEQPFLVKTEDCIEWIYYFLSLSFNSLSFSFSF